MFTEDFDSLKMKISKSTNKREQEDNNCQQRRYHRPEVYLLGSLEQVQGGATRKSWFGPKRDRQSHMEARKNWSFLMWSSKK